MLESGKLAGKLWVLCLLCKQVSWQSAEFFLRVAEFFLRVAEFFLRVAEFFLKVAKLFLGIRMNYS